MTDAEALLAAVWAAPDDDPANPGGWRAIVAIADVSFYVRPGSLLDREARKRGNSVYFPDRVVPMLPEALSNGVHISVELELSPLPPVGPASTEGSAPP